jgi:hypothetical protein
MKNHTWLLACLALIAAGAIAGCGGGDDDGATATITSGSGETTTASIEESSGATPEDVYQACLDALEGVGSESVVQTGCAQARDAFEQCATQASNAPEGSARDQALEACQEAADQTTDALKASP